MGDRNRLSELPPGTRSNYVTAGMMPQQYVDIPPCEIYQNSPLALVVPKWHQLIALARTLSQQQQQHALAVVIAAAAGEWSASFVLRELLDASPKRSEAIDRLNRLRKLRPGTIVWSLENPGMCKAYRELTGKDPSTQSWWTDWMTSRKVRHDIVHKGDLTADAAVAKQCIDAAETYVAHLINVAQGFGVPTP